jgi:hypothetical protein
MIAKAVLVAAATDEKRADKKYEDVVFCKNHYLLSFKSEVDSNPDFLRWRESAVTPGQSFLATSSRELRGQFRYETAINFMMLLECVNHF